jgi:hypothetical protein
MEYWGVRKKTVLQIINIRNGFMGATLQVAPMNPSTKTYRSTAEVEMVHREMEDVYGKGC